MDAKPGTKEPVKGTMSVGHNSGPVEGSLRGGEEREPRPTNLLIGLRGGGFGNLPRILRLIDSVDGQLKKIESRRAHGRSNGGPMKGVMNPTAAASDRNFDLFLGLEISQIGLLGLVREIRQGDLAEVEILREPQISIKGNLQRS